MYILLTEIPKLGKQGKCSPCSPNHPDTQDSFSTWLGNNKINTCTNLLTGTPSKSPRVNQHIPMLHSSQVLTKYMLHASGTGYILSQYKRSTITFLPALVPHQHEFC